MPPGKKEGKGKEGKGKRREEGREGERKEREGEGPGPQIFWSRTALVQPHFQSRKPGI